MKKLLIVAAVLSSVLVSGFATSSTTKEVEIKIDQENQIAEAIRIRRERLVEIEVDQENQIAEAIRIRRERLVEIKVDQENQIAEAIRIRRERLA